MERILSTSEREEAREAFKLPSGVQAHVLAQLTILSAASSATAAASAAATSVNVAKSTSAWSAWFIKLGTAKTVALAVVLGGAVVGGTVGGTSCWTRVPAPESGVAQRNVVERNVAQRPLPAFSPDGVDSVHASDSVQADVPAPFEASVGPAAASASLHQQVTPRWRAEFNREPSPSASADLPAANHADLQAHEASPTEGVQPVQLLAAEAAAIRELDRAISTGAADVTARYEAYRRNFGSGSLHDEAEALMVLHACAHRRDPTRAESCLLLHPNVLVRARVLSACGAEDSVRTLE